jgi:hypothetical protein
MFKDYWKYDWVLPVYQYEGLEPLLATLAEKVIAPAEHEGRPWCQPVPLNVTTSS